MSQQHHEKNKMIINKEDDFVIHLTRRDLEQLKYVLEYVIEEWRENDDAADYFSLRQELQRWYKSMCSVSGSENGLLDD